MEEAEMNPKGFIQLGQVSQMAVQKYPTFYQQGMQEQENQEFSLWNGL